MKRGIATTLKGLLYFPSTLGFPLMMNKTSKIAEEMRKGASHTIHSRPHRVAVGEKYKRMEKALEQIRSSKVVDKEEGENYTLRDACDDVLLDPLRKYAAEALDYDPLFPEETNP